MSEGPTVTEKRGPFHTLLRETENMTKSVVEAAFGESLTIPFTNKKVSRAELYGGLYFGGHIASELAIRALTAHLPVPPELTFALSFGASKVVDAATVATIGFMEVNNGIRWASGHVRELAKNLKYRGKGE